MTNNDFLPQEKVFGGTIEKIKLLSGIKPKENWVIFCRANLAMRLKMERQQELLRQDMAFLPGLFDFLKSNWQPKHLFKTAYVGLIAVLLLISGGALTAGAAMKSLPGSPLYRVKIALENARLLIVSDAQKSKLQTEITSRRLDELKTVVDSSDSSANKAEKITEVVGQIQQQLDTDKASLPKVAQRDSSRAISAAKDVSERAEQVKKAINETKDSLSSEIKPDLSEKLAEVSEAAKKTSLQALETLINKENKTDADKTEIAVKFDEIIRGQETALGTLSASNLSATSQATSTADRLPINAVLVNQTDEAKDMLAQLKAKLSDGNFTDALAMLKTVNEIINSAEKIASNAGLPADPAKPSQSPSFVPEASSTPVETRKNESQK